MKWMGIACITLALAGAVNGEDTPMRTLNNFVTELLSVPSVAQGEAAYPFENPRAGWVFLSLSGQADVVEKLPEMPRAILDDRTEPLVWRMHPKSKCAEAMQLLTEGAHRIRVSGWTGARLIVRAVPEIQFCYYPGAPHIAPFGPYDWAYVNRYVLSDVNTLITAGKVEPEESEQWLREGRQWIANAALPGLSAAEAPAADAVFQEWTKNPGVTQPGFAGMIVDEFGGNGAKHYQAWGEAVKRLHAEPGFSKRTFYAWCGDLSNAAHTLAFSRLLMDLGDRFAWEVYLDEKPTEEQAIKSIRRMSDEFKHWKAAAPGLEKHMVMCLGYLSAPPESLNVNPGVDYHVFMDMQFQALATDPEFAGLYGIMEYMASYADEESLRYAQQLFRHYCIEGERTRYNDDPYLLPHLKNPDFADGLTDWRVEPAEPDAIDVKEMKGFGWLEGRYPETRAGDRCCWMQRSAKGPNHVRQTVKQLTPGRLYSVKLLSGDLQHLDANQPVTPAIDVNGVEVLKEFTIHHVFPSCYSHEVALYTHEHPAYLTFHRIVFRPKESTADLRISDSTSPADPGGAAQQQTVFNFVEVQPFHAP